MGDNNFVGVRRGEVQQRLNTPKIREGGPGTPQVDWSVLADLRQDYGSFCWFRFDQHSLTTVLC